MSKQDVICTLPNAAEEINGVAFEAHPDGYRIAHDVPVDEAENFASIPGYEIAGAGAGKAAKADKGNNGGETDEASPIASMTVAEIAKLLEEHPSAWEDVEAVEQERDSPRNGVVKLVEQARAECEAADEADE
jgi:hypothetical protein